MNVGLASIASKIPKMHITTTAKDQEARILERFIVLELKTVIFICYLFEHFLLFLNRFYVMSNG